MKVIKFSNAEVKKIVDVISKKKPWNTKESAIDGKFTIELKNNPSKSKIDIFADNKLVDDYPYDIDEKDDVYATVLNVLDYLTNLMNKYNKKHTKVVKEEVTPSEIATVMQITGESKKVVEAMSKGMLRAYSRKMKEQDIHYTCKACDTAIPKYKGRYGSKCPSCGESIVAMKEKDHEIAVGAAFNRGATVKVQLADPDDFWNARVIAYQPETKAYAIELTDGPDAGKVYQGIMSKQIRQ